MSHIEELREFIHEYALKKDLSNTLLALNASHELLKGKIRKCAEFDKEGVLNQTYYEHCMLATKLLIDLQIPLSAEEEDILLAATLCHDTIAHADFERGGLELMDVYHLDPRSYEIVRVTTKGDIDCDEQLQEFYDKIRVNKLAVLMAMADRSNLVENIYALSITEALDYIGEIRCFALPMCVYALDHYPDIQMAMDMLVSKIHTLIDVTDIISRRYQDREISYNKEILSLMEENSKLHGMIRQIRGD